MSDLVKRDNPEPNRHPKQFISKKRAVIRIRNEKTKQIEQYQGTIYRLDPNDESALVLHGGHQVIVLDKEIPEFENYTIVAMVELW
jgi:hypothetical protein